MTTKKVPENYRPLSDRVVVERDESEKVTKGGIVLPDVAKDIPARGTVVAVGPGKLLESGERSKLQVEVGDHVIFSKYGGETFKINDDEMVLLREDDLLAVVE